MQNGFHFLGLKILILYSVGIANPNNQSDPFAHLNRLLYIRKDKVFDHTSKIIFFNESIILNS